MTGLVVGVGLMPQVELSTSKLVKRQLTKKIPMIINFISYVIERMFLVPVLNFVENYYLETGKFKKADNKLVFPGPQECRETWGLIPTNFWQIPYSCHHNPLLNSGVGSETDAS